MEEILKFRKIYDLKNINRMCSVKNRKESSAEHSWSCLILADYLLGYLKDYDIDRLKVYELLMYHDVVEIYAGDISILEEKTDLIKKKKCVFEKESADILRNELPEYIADKFFNLFLEFEKGVTVEAKFARLVDALDPMIQEIGHKDDFKGFSREFLISKKLIFFEDFPELKTVFVKILDYYEREGYF